jgi:uncharacterized radical SAM superfamily Fe-S cluster-containing enzyme
MSPVEKVKSLCPICRRLIEGQIFFRDNRVLMRKHCPDHGSHEARIFGDARLYQEITKFNKPGVLPLEFTTLEEAGCPFDCGLCPRHEQHLCLAIIEVNSGCNLDCPLCLANSGTHLARSGFELTIDQVEFMLDRLFATEEHPEVIQFSGGEPSLHPRILDFIELAQDKGIDYVLLNTNGIRIANDDRFLSQLAHLKPHVYLQFDGFDPATYRTLRGREDLLKIKLRALDRLAEVDVHTALVPAIESGVNEHEIGSIVEFGLRHPAVYGVSFQSAFRAQRHPTADPLTRVTTPDILKALEAQTDGLFRLSDFIPVPCCSPTCGFSTYAILDGDEVIPLPRVLEVDRYLTYLENRTMPALEQDLILALEALWSASATAGSRSTTTQIQRAIAGKDHSDSGRGDGRSAERCSACRGALPLSEHTPRELAKHVFMITTRDFMDVNTFNTSDLLKCCIGVLIPDGRTIPFCAYNTVGYREQVVEALHQQAGSKIED